MNYYQATLVEIQTCCRRQNHLWFIEMFTTRSEEKKKGGGG